MQIWKEKVLQAGVYRRERQVGVDCVVLFLLWTLFPQAHESRKIFEWDLQIA